MSFRPGARLSGWRIAARLLIAGLFAYCLVIGVMCQIYVSGLLHPTCWRAEQAPAGYQDVTLKTEDGVTIRGWWRAPQNGTAVLLLPGLGGSRDVMLPDAAMLAQHGYGVLSLDSRSCDGKQATLGYREVADLRAGVRFTHQQPGVRWLAAMGFSAGGVTVIRGAARIPEIDAVIAEGNFYTLWGEIADSGAPPLSLEWQIERGVGLLVWLETGVWPGAVSPIDDLPLIQPRPVLLIHGEKEAGRNHAQAQYAAAGEPKQLWIVPGADHGTYRSVAAQQFEDTVLGFLEHYRP